MAATLHRFSNHSPASLYLKPGLIMLLCRYERSGTMHGLFRVRGFTQDDAHIFCLPNQIATEIRGVLDLVEDILSTFGFTKYEVNLSTRPEKSVGSDEIWSQSEAALVEALTAKGWSYGIDEVRQRLRWLQCLHSEGCITTAVAALPSRCSLHPIPFKTRVHSFLLAGIRPLTPRCFPRLYHPLDSWCSISH